MTGPAYRRPDDVRHASGLILEEYIDRISAVRAGADDGFGGTYNNTVKSVRLGWQEPAQLVNSELPLVLIVLDLPKSYDNGVSPLSSRVTWSIDLAVFGRDRKGRSSSKKTTDIAWVMESLLWDIEKALVAKLERACLTSASQIQIDDTRQEYAPQAEIGLGWIGTTVTYTRDFTA